MRQIGYQETRTATDWSHLFREVAACPSNPGSASTKNTSTHLWRVPRTLCGDRQVRSPERERRTPDQTYRHLEEGRQNEWGKSPGVSVLMRALQQRQQPANLLRQQSTPMRHFE